MLEFAALISPGPRRGVADAPERNAWSRPLDLMRYSLPRHVALIISVSAPRITETPHSSPLGRGFSGVVK
jgi:hypothetical protein